MKSRTVANLSAVPLNFQDIFLGLTLLSPGSRDIVFSIIMDPYWGVSFLPFKLVKIICPNLLPIPISERFVEKTDVDSGKKGVVEGSDSVCRQKHDSAIVLELT